MIRCSYSISTPPEYLKKRPQTIIGNGPGRIGYYYAAIMVWCTWWWCVSTSYVVQPAVMSCAHYSTQLTRRSRRLSNRINSQNWLRNKTQQPIVAFLCCKSELFCFVSNRKLWQLRPPNMRWKIAWKATL